MPKQIIIRIDRQGQTKIDVQGCTGKECLSLTQPVEKLLGDASGREQKPEMFAEVEQQQQIHG